MPISDYKGPANSREVFQHLVGETIRAAFVNKKGEIILVFPSGDAIAFGGLCGGPSYWKLQKDEVGRMVADRRLEIEAKLAELRDLPDPDRP